VDKRARVHGTVSPKAPHHAADLQLRSGKRWRTVAKTHLSKQSGFTFSYRPPDVGRFALRIAVPSGSGHRAGHSKRLHLHVQAAPFTALATDDNDTTCADVEGGTMQCWGRPFNYVDPAPVAIPGFSHARQVATTGFTQCAIVKTGSVMCEGTNAAGQLGNGTTNYSTTPVRVLGMHPAVNLAGDNDHFCAVKTDKSVWCWGENRDDQVGSTSVTEGVSKPVKVAGLGPATSVAAGPTSSCATLTTGAVSCWGRPINDNSVTDDTPTPQPIAVIGRAVSVSIGFIHACAVMRSGEVECWGNNDFGELGEASSPASATPIIAAGITTAQVVSAGSYFTCVVLQGGTVTCFGADSSGQLGNGTSAEYGEAKVHGITDAAAVTASNGYACALLARGTARCWGTNIQSTLGDGHSGGFRDLPQPVAPLAWDVTEVDHVAAVHAGHPIDVTGEVSPATAGRGVTLTVFDLDTQKVLLSKRTTLSSHSRYRFRYTPTSLDPQLLYTTIAKTKYHSRGTSDELDLSVVPMVVSLAAGQRTGSAVDATR
jgi:hypothetical protein